MRRCSAACPPAYYHWVFPPPPVAAGISQAGGSVELWAAAGLAHEAPGPALPPSAPPSWSHPVFPLSLLLLLLLLPPPEPHPPPRLLLPPVQLPGGGWG